MSHDIDRRGLLAISAAAAATMGAAPALAGGMAQDHAMAQHARTMGAPPDGPTIAMLVYPQMVALDLIGPLTAFNIARFRTQLVWKDKAPVMTETGIPVPPTATFAEVPKDVDVLFVPGGIIGTTACMNDPEVLGFLADRGARAKWVTSVCTGSLVIAAAGLLKGYDATSLWAVADLLPLMGARHVDKRVVRDRNRLTGGGVTAGIDFGLALVAELLGEDRAKNVQLTIEYSPEPPFRSGTPAEAGPQRTEYMRGRRAGMDVAARTAAEAAGRRLGISSSMKS